MKWTRAVFAAGLALAAVALQSAPIAVSKTCDWGTDAGVQACLGGAPFDAGKNGNGDTYGPTGEAGFVSDVRLILPSIGRLNDAQILELGHAACDLRRQGFSEQRVKDIMAATFNKNRLDPDDSGYFTIDAEMYLCPGLK